MKKKILAIVASMMALGVSAQGTDYQWKMTNFHTDDNYQICSFAYDANSRLLAVSDSIRGEYNVIDSMAYVAAAQNDTVPITAKIIWLMVKELKII